MILPGSNNFVGYIGGTFDTIITVYPTADDIYNWRGTWALGVNYSVNDAVVGSDSNAYVAIQASTSITPVGNPSYWTLLTPMNLTGYSATLVLGPSGSPTLTLTTGSGITMGGAAGTISIKMTPVQTASIPAGNLHYYIAITDPSANIYYYMNGTFTWSTP